MPSLYIKDECKPSCFSFSLHWEEGLTTAPAYHSETDNGQLLNSEATDRMCRTISLGHRIFSMQFPLLAPGSSTAASLLLYLFYTEIILFPSLLLYSSVKSTVDSLSSLSTSPASGITPNTLAAK